MKSDDRDLQDGIDDLWKEVEEEEKERSRRALHDLGALDITIRAMAGELLAELTVNGRCTVAQLCRELSNLVPPQPRSEYRLAVATEALQLSDRLCDKVSSGAELTALVIESLSGDFFCQAAPDREVTLCLSLDRSARCHVTRTVGGLKFDNQGSGSWEELPPGSGRLNVTLDQHIGAIGEYVVKHFLELEKLEGGDLRVVRGEIHGGGALDPNLLFGSAGDIFG
eukprot:TRINITY_DN57437_c0_g1_i1.p1 TRINITY_DN57437_c0_g1~~TRINITY_DN57437_c0_g1_i1.p1  ORF type:complete len:225 (-),score=47.16 TRINITY_DN57437_c0_g1_i1:38-712(-)